MNSKLKHSFPIIHPCACKWVKMRGFVIPITALATNDSSYFLKVSLSIVSLYCMAGVMTKFCPNIEKLLFILQKDSGPIQHLKWSLCIILPSRRNIYGNFFLSIIINHNIFEMIGNLLLFTPTISHVHLIIDDNEIFLALAFFKTAFSFSSLLTIVHFTSLGVEN